MAMSNKGFTKAIEECSELIQVLAKKIAFMNLEFHPGGMNMDKEVINETGDALAAIEFMIEKNNLDRQAIQARKNMKLDRYQYWDSATEPLLDRFKKWMNW